MTGDLSRDGLKIDLYKDEQCSSVICILNSGILNENKWKRKYKLVNLIVLYNEMTDVYQYIQKLFEIIAK